MEYPEFYPGTKYYIGNIVKVTAKNSLFKAARNFTASAIPSENSYWDYVGPIPVDPNALTLEKLDTRLKAVEAKLNTTPDPIPTTPTPSGYLSLPISTAKTISGQTDLIFENIRFENTDTRSLHITNSSGIIFRNCFFNKSAAEAIAIENSKNIIVERCLFNGVESGVYALNSHTIKVNNNQFVNMRQRRRADGSGAGLGQFVQFDKSGGPGCEIMNNKGENFFGESDPEDMVNMFSSSGTAASPILIKGNVFRGGGPSNSGGGILAGDYNGSYITIDGNTLMNPGQYGIAIAGGNNNIVTNNKIFSKQFEWSNIAIYIWMQGGATSCSNNTIKGNRASWINRDGGSNVGWNAGNCVNTIWETPTPITEAEMNMPDHLIDFITPEELLTIRK